MAGLSFHRPIVPPYCIEDCWIFFLSFYLVGAAAALQGAVNMGLPDPLPDIGKRRRKRATEKELQFLKYILNKVFCDGIPVGSIVPGSCDLKVLDYNNNVCSYLLTFTMEDASAVVEALNEVNEGIAENKVITDAGITASPGPIGGFS